LLAWFTLNAFAAVVVHRSTPHRYVSTHLDMDRRRALRFDHDVELLVIAIPRMWLSLRWTLGPRRCARRTALAARFFARRALRP